HDLIERHLRRNELEIVSGPVTGACRSSLPSSIVSFILLACPVFVVELPQNLVPVLRHRLSYNGVQLLSQLVMQAAKDGLRSSHHFLVLSGSCRQKLSRTLGCSQSSKDS